MLQSHPQVVELTPGRGWFPILSQRSSEPRMSVNPVNHWDVLKISAATKGRARRLSAATGHPIHVLTEKLFLHWEDSYIARMTPAEVERYMAGKMTFEEAQRISWRLRKDVLPIPDDPAP